MRNSPQLPSAHISIHALREEGDDQSLTPTMGVKQFLSTPSARRATKCPCKAVPIVIISIHALREEGDETIADLLLMFGKFLSTPSARRATSRSSFRSRPAAYFYPRPPRGGRRKMLGRRFRLKLFLSTPSARRATLIPV